MIKNKFATLIKYESVMLERITYFFKSQIYLWQKIAFSGKIAHLWFCFGHCGMVFTLTNGINHYI